MKWEGAPPLREKFPMSWGIFTQSLIITIELIITEIKTMVLIYSLSCLIEALFHLVSIKFAFVFISNEKNANMQS